MIGAFAVAFHCGPLELKCWQAKCSFFLIKQTFLDQLFDKLIIKHLSQHKLINKQQNWKQPEPTGIINWNITESNSTHKLSTW